MNKINKYDLFIAITNELVRQNPELKVSNIDFDQIIEYSKKIKDSVTIEDIKDD